MEFSPLFHPSAASTLFSSSLASPSLCLFGVFLACCQYLSTSVSPLSLSEDKQLDPNMVFWGEPRMYPVKNTMKPWVNPAKKQDYMTWKYLRIYFLSCNALHDLKKVFGIYLDMIIVRMILAAATTLETSLERPCTQTIVNELLHSKQPLRTIASHELLHELLRQKTAIVAAPLAETTPSPNF